MDGGKVEPVVSMTRARGSLFLRQKSKSLTNTTKISSHKNNNKRHFSRFFFLHLFILKYRHYLQHCPHIPLTALWGQVCAGQWGRLLDSEARRWRGVLCPFTQPFCRLFSPPFRMSWMCCTIKLMATARNKSRLGHGPQWGRLTQLEKRASILKLIACSPHTANWRAD